MNNKDIIAVTSRSFSKNEFLVSKLKELYSSVILNNSGKTLQGNDLVDFLKPASKAIIGIEDITDNILSQLPSLKIISKYGVGLNNIDLESMKIRKIKLGFTKGVNKQSVAEHAFTMILIGLKKIHANHKQILEGFWSQEKGSDLAGKNIGILGFGNIGQQLVSLIQPFKCKIFFYDERIFNKIELKDLSKQNNWDHNLIYQESLDKILGHVDILSIHLPLNNETNNILTSFELNKLKYNVCIINTARGGIVNEKDLYHFLLENPAAFAGFDVFLEEPAFDNILLSLPNFFGTSHRSSLTNEGIDAMGLAAIDGLEDNIKN